MTPELKNSHAVFGLLGSFWGRSLTPTAKQQARTLVRSSEKNATQDALTRPARGLAFGKIDTEGRIGISVNPESIVTLGPDLQARVTTEFQDLPLATWEIKTVPSYASLSSSPGWIGILTEDMQHALATENGGILLVPSPDGDAPNGFSLVGTQWAMALPYGVKPIAFSTKKGLRVLGMDFVLSGGFAVFSESPFELFDLPVVEVFSQQTNRRSRWLFPLGLDFDGDSAGQVSLLYRGNQSTDQFARAIAASLGYSVLSSDSQLLHVSPLGEGFRYTFDSVTIHADYTHTPLAIGAYAAGTIIGGLVRATGASNARDLWWRKLDWSTGLPLDAVTPFSGIVAPDNYVQVAATTESSAHPGHYHCRISLLGDPAVLDKFWKHQESQEDSTGIFLSDSLGLGAGHSTQINPLEYFFTNFLDNRAVVVDISRQTGDAARYAAAVKFIAREKPVSSVVIVRST